MSKDTKTPRTLTDEDIVTSPAVSRRTLLAGAGMALGAAAIAGRSSSAFAAGKSKKDGKSEKDKPAGKSGNDKSDKSKIETTRDKD